MSIIKPERLINMTLRGMTLVSKFLLIFFLAKFLQPAEVGLYGLFVATLGYSLYLVGLDFYTYTTREILQRNRNEWGGLLYNQVALTFVLYTLFVPFLLLLFAVDMLPWHLAFWFFVLLVLEHCTQELMRLLITISEQITASLVLFLRSGAWAIIIVALMLVLPELRSLEVILFSWTVGGAVAALLAFLRLHRLGVGGWQEAKVDWSWIKRGIRIALPLLMATLAVRGLYTFDKYWLQVLAGQEILGAYVLFIGIANALMSFLDAGVFAFSYPTLITTFQQRQASEFKYELKRLLIQTIVLSCLFVVVALLLIDPLLQWLDRPLYIEQKGMFSWVLLGAFIFAIGMVPHYALYAQNQDRPIIQSHIASLIIFFSVTWFFSLHWSYIAIPLGLCIAFFSIALWKLYAFFRLTPARFYSHQP